MNFSHVIPGSGLLVWVKVVSALGGTSYKWDASPLFLTRWQHNKDRERWFNADLVAKSTSEYHALINWYISI